MRNPLLDDDFLRDLSERRERITYARIVALTMREEPMDEITGRVTQGSVNIDGTSSVRRSFSLNLVAEDFDINNYYWGLNTKVRLYIGLHNEINDDYPEIIWFDQGVFIISTFNTSQSVNSYSITMQGKDKMCLLNGELGGVIESLTADFGIEKIQYTDNNGKLCVEKRSLPLKNIINEVVHKYANEPFSNIIVNDLDQQGLELMEYREPKNPLYFLIDIGSSIVENIRFNGDAEYINAETNQPIKLKDIPIYDKRMEKGLVDQDAPTRIKALDGDTLYVVAKAEYGQTCGYQLTDLTYPGELVGKVGEPVTTAVLDKIVKMLGDFEYFYDTDGRFIFQKKKTYASTPWVGIQESELITTYEEIELSKYDYQPSLYYILDEGKYKLSTKAYDSDAVYYRKIVRPYSSDQFVVMNVNDETYVPGMYYTKKNGNYALCHWAYNPNETYYQKVDGEYATSQVETSAVTYSFEGSRMVTAFNNSPNYPNLRNDFSIWGERKSSVSDSKIPIHLRYAIDSKPYFYRTLCEDKTKDKIDGKIYTTREDIFDIIRAEKEQSILQGFYDKANSFVPQYRDGIPDKFIKAEKRSDGSWTPGWWDIRDWYNYYKTLTDDEPNATMKWYSFNSPEGYTYVDGYYCWLVIEYKNGGFSYGHGGVKSVPDPNYTVLSTKNVSYYDESSSSGYVTVRTTDKKPFMSPFSGCSDNHTYINFLENDIKKSGNKVYFYNPKFPEADSFEDLVKKEVEEEIERLKEIGAFNLVDWREIVYQMALDYGKYGHDDDFLLRVYNNNENMFNEDGTTGYEQYYTDMASFWREDYDPKPPTVMGLPNYAKQYYTWNTDTKSYDPIDFFAATTITQPDSNVVLYRKLGNKYYPLKTTGDFYSKESTIFIAIEEDKKYFIKDDNDNYIPYGYVLKDGKYVLPEGPIHFTLGNTYYIDNGYERVNLLEPGGKYYTKVKVDDRCEYVESLNLPQKSYYVKESGVGENQYVKVLSLSRGRTYYNNDGSQELFSYPEDKFYYRHVGYTKILELPPYDKYDVYIDEDDNIITGDLPLKKNIFYYKRIVAPTNGEKYYQKIDGVMIEEEYFKTFIPGVVYYIKNGDHYEEYNAFQFKTDIPIYDNTTYNPETGWALNVTNNPSLLNFWFDFLDTDADIQKYSVKVVGNRPKAVNDEKIKAIYYKDTPSVIFVKSKNWNAERDIKAGYTYVKVTPDLEGLFTLSTQGKDVMTELDNFIYNFACCTESITLTAVPIYHLQPNTRITIRDEKSHIDGEYIISKITLPLAYNGTMSITAVKAAESLF